MKFQIGQTFIEIDLLTNLKGFTFRLIAPIGETNMLKIGATIEANEVQPLVASAEIYKRGSENA
jgi:hypothetical protein